MDHQNPPTAQWQPTQPPQQQWQPTQPPPQPQWQPTQPPPQQWQPPQPPPQPQWQPTQPPQQQWQPPVQPPQGQQWSPQLPQQQETQISVVPVKKKGKPGFVLGGIGGLAAIAAVVILVFTMTTRNKSDLFGGGVKGDFLSNVSGIVTDGKIGEALGGDMVRALSAAVSQNMAVHNELEVYLSLRINEALMSQMGEDPAMAAVINSLGKISVKLDYNSDPSRGAMDITLTASAGDISLSGTVIMADDGMYILLPELFSKAIFISSDELGDMFSVPDLGALSDMLGNSDDIFALLDKLALTEAENKIVMDALVDFLKNNITDDMIKTNKGVEFHGKTYDELVLDLRDGAIEKLMAAFIRDVLQNARVKSIVISKLELMTGSMDLGPGMGSLAPGAIGEQYDYTLSMLASQLLTAEPMDAYVTIAVLPGADEPDRLIVTVGNPYGGEAVTVLYESYTSGGTSVFTLSVTANVGGDPFLFSLTTTEQPSGDTAKCTFKAIITTGGYDSVTAGIEMNYDVTVKDSVTSYIGTYTLIGLPYGTNLDGRYEISVKNTDSESFFNVLLEMSPVIEGMDVGSITVGMNLLTRQGAEVAQPPRDAVALSDLSEWDMQEIQQNLMNLLSQSPLFASLINPYGY